jgi:antitoxin component YwqK of YwqJK toxin-antitoxin module
MNKILETYSEFIDDPKYVFAVAQKIWIVILQKTDDTITNEHREDIKNKLYASYKGNHFIVKKIFNKITGEIKQNINGSTYNDTIIYSLNEKISTELTFIITYYNVIQRAYYLYNNLLFTGMRTYWFNNGLRMAHIDYTCGIKNGVYIRWNINGNIYMTGEYTNGDKSGMWISYDGNKLICHDVDNNDNDNNVDKLENNNDIFEFNDWLILS